MKLQHSQKAFTVLELLIVIAIIGVLSTIVLAALGSSRDKATNAKVAAQLSSMRTQSELFYAKHQNYGTLVTGLDCSSATLFDGSDPDGLGALIAGTPDGYHVSCYSAPDPLGDPTVAAYWSVFVSPDGSGTRWCTDETHQVVSDEDMTLVSPGSCYIPRWP